MSRLKLKIYTWFERRRNLEALYLADAVKEGISELYRKQIAKDDYLAIITSYIPDPEQWSTDFKRRL